MGFPPVWSTFAVLALFSDPVPLVRVRRQGHNAVWSFQCGCGKVFEALAANVTRGNTRSCGCRRVKVSEDKARTHGLSKHPVYVVWNNMRRRCYDEKNAAFKNYGGRGITICAEWHDLSVFYRDMWPRPRGATIERIDNALGYSPSNCRWASRKEQGNNQRRNTVLDIDGIARTVAQWAEHLGIPSARIRGRLRLGWSAKDALNTTEKWHMKVIG